MGGGSRTHGIYRRKKVREMETEEEEGRSKRGNKEKENGMRRKEGGERMRRRE